MGVNMCPPACATPRGPDLNSLLLRGIAFSTAARRTWWRHASAIRIAACRGFTRWRMRPAEDRDRGGALHGGGELLPDLALIPRIVTERLSRTRV